MKRSVLVFLLLTASVFLFAPINKAKAVDYGCFKDDEACHPISIDEGYNQAIAKCAEYCGVPNTYIADNDRCQFTNQPCPEPREFGCTVHSGDQCTPLIAADLWAARYKCRVLCATTGGVLERGINCVPATFNPCPTLQDFGCIREGVCDNIKAFDFKTADGKCVDRCAAGKGGTCTSIKNPCPSPGTLLDASVGNLKIQAGLLNKLGIIEPSQLVGRFIQILMSFIGSIALALYVWSGFLWMTASGNADQVTKAKTTMVWTTLGVGIMLASYMLVGFLFKSLGL